MKGSVGKWGNSLAVRLPQAAAEAAGLREGHRVRIEAVRGRVTIAAEPLPEYTLKELVRGYSRRRRHAETKWGRPRGEEAW